MQKAFQKIKKNLRCSFFIFSPRINVIILSIVFNTYSFASKSCVHQMLHYHSRHPARSITGFPSCSSRYEDLQFAHSPASSAKTPCGYWMIYVCSFFIIFYISNILIHAFFIPPQKTRGAIDVLTINPSGQVVHVVGNQTST